MSVAQTKATRRKMLARYGDARKFGYSIHEAIEREKVKAERERAAAMSKKKSK